VVATTTDPLPIMRAAPAKTTVPVPNEEPRTVASAPAPRRARASSQQRPQQQNQQKEQQQRSNSAGGLFQLFR
jgi:ribosomal protein L12E/L44/L45/RPP1/RPP2